MSDEITVVPGRNCSGCTLCCKLLSVAELDKPPLAWCSHCKVGSGCGIYADRPTECREFYCGYLLDPGLDERWKPALAKLIVSFEPHDNAILIHVDPDHPDAWRAEPFRSQIRRWAARLATTGGQMIVWQGDTKIVIAPDPPLAHSAAIP